jgi:PAS domain S-box-containing protein
MKSELKFKSLITNVPGVIFRCMNDKNRTIIFIEGDIELLTGYSADDFVDNKKRTFESLIYVYDENLIKQKINEALSQKTTWEIYYRILYKNGDIRWIQERGRGVYSQDGDVEYLERVMFDATKEKNKDEELQQYKTAVEQAMDGIAIADLKGNLVYVNKSWARMHGYFQEELVGKNLRIHHTKEQMEKEVNPFNNNVINKGIFNATINHINKDGSVFPAEMSTSLLADNFGNPFALLGVARDVTQREIEEKFQKLLSDVLKIISKNNIKDTLIKETLVTIKEATACDAIGIRLEKDGDYPYYSQIGFPQNFLEKEKTLVTSEYKCSNCYNPKLSCSCGMVVMGETAENKSLVSKSGIFWMNDLSLLKELSNDPRLEPRNYCLHYGYSTIALLPLKNKGKTVGLLQLNYFRKNALTQEAINVLETIALHLAESLLRIKAEDNLNVIIKNIPIALMIINKNKQIRFINEKAKELIGYNNSQEIIGSTCTDIFCLTNRNVCPIWDEKQPLDNSEKTLRNKNNEIKDILKTAIPINYDNEDVLLEAFVDISNIKEHEQKLLEYNKQLEQSNEELKAFAYVASHDLKEPLRGISNQASFIKMDFPNLEEGAIKKINHIVTLAERLDIFINELLNYSRFDHQNLRFQNNNVYALAKEVIENINLTKYSQDSEIILKELPNIVCDKERLKYVFQNLIVNGLKYNDKIEKKIEIGAYYKEEKLIFYIYDNGIGIDEKYSEIIFQLFKRLHSKKEYEGGTGVGLSIVKKIIMQHNGEIWFRSDDNGTTFYFTLDAKEGVNE